MFKFLLGVAFGAAGYWAWQSFGRDLLGLGNDQDMYGGYSSSNNYGSSSSSAATSSTTSTPGTPSSTGTTPGA